MEDYFEKSVEQFTARIGQALDSIPTDLSDEQAVLATKCSTRLNQSQIRLSALLSSSASHASNKDAKLREFQRIVRDIEYVESVGLAALERSNELDEKLNLLVKQIRKEIQCPLPLPPVVTATSKDYFYIHTRFSFNLICVPPGERNSLLHLPDLYHELAHPLITEKNSLKIQPFQSGLTQIRDLALEHFTTEILRQSRRRGPNTYQAQAEVWLRHWYQSWSTEFLCDLYAVYALGPAFVWSHYNLCAKKTDNPFETGLKMAATHPADDARMYVMLLALDRIGFTDEANQIQKRWNEFIESSALNKEIEYAQCYPKPLLNNIEDISYKAVTRTQTRLVNSDTNDYIHSVLNKAWERFWENQESYVDWEREEIKRLYKYCEEKCGSLRSNHNSDILHQNMRKRAEDSKSETQAIFTQSLTELKQSILRSADFVREFPFLASDDIKNLQFEFKDPVRGGIYDHVRFERKFYLSDQLLNFYGIYWKSKEVSDEQKKKMCKLFMLHEFLHIQQHVDSNTYPYSKNSKNSFRYIDYDADAFAVKTSLKTELSYLPWNQHLVEILIAHVHGGEVFSLADDGRESQSIDGERLHRQLIWFFQYARARYFRAESDFNSFHIDRHVIIEVFAIRPDGVRDNLCVKPSVSSQDFAHLIDLNLSWAGIRYRHSLTVRHSIDNLIKGIFNCDFDSISEAFRPLFDSHPELTGRDTQSSFSIQSNHAFDRIEFIQKLRSLHSEDLGQIIISIPGASQKITENETTSKKLEQLILWSESSLGPGIEKILEVAKKLYPTHF